MALYTLTGEQINTAYNTSGTAITQAYDIDGHQLLNPHKVSNSYTRTLILENSENVAGTQGLACDSITQTIAQLYSGKIIAYDISTGEYTQVAGSLNLGHGTSGQFAPEKGSNDSYPMLYVSTGHSVTVDDENYYGILIEMKIGEIPSKANRIFAVPDGGGYSGLFAIDFDNDILYHVQTEAYRSSTAEITNISAWDMTSYVTFDDLPWVAQVTNGRYMLNNKLFSFTIPYVNEVQSLTFFDGLIALFSDDGYVQFVDPESRSVYMTINKNMPDFEREGIGFVLNETTEQYDMVLSNRKNEFASYYRYEFDL